MKKVKAWAIVHDGKLQILFNTYLVYPQRSKAVSRIEGSPIMTTCGYKVVPVTITSTRSSGEK